MNTLALAVCEVCCISLWVPLIEASAIRNSPVRHVLDSSKHLEGRPGKRIIVTPSKISLRSDGAEHQLLSLDELPAESKLAPGIALGRDRFSTAVLSPDGKQVAFAVDGQHAWCGLYNAARKRTWEVALFFDGSVTQISFSPDGRRLAVEGVGPSSFSSLFLWDLRTSRPIPVRAFRGPAGEPAEVRFYEWRGASPVVRVRWPDSRESSRLWILEVRNDAAEFKPLE
jgi:hypothetical protein